ncbi:MAG: endonuclease SmrB, partial [Plesiomonas sp.]
MKKKHTLSEDDTTLFRDAIQGAKKIKQDTIIRPRIQRPERVEVREQQEQRDASFYFSDEFQPRLSEEGPMRYVREDVSHYELKQLRRGDFT